MVNTGDVVILVGDFEKKWPMTITDTKDSEGIARCCWFNLNGEIQAADLTFNSIVKYEDDCPL